MAVTDKYRYLIRIAGSINVFFLLLGVTFIVYLGSSGSRLEHLHAFVKIVTFSTAIVVCWLINILLLVFLVPVAGKGRYVRWVAFYIPSFLITSALGLLIANSPLYFYVAHVHIRDTISGPVVFVAGINALSLVAIELILARYESNNIKLEYATMKAENAELKVKSLQAEHLRLKTQLHPHFLFNSLNTLTSLIRRDPEQAENYLIKLSDFLRFSITHNEQNVVPLQEELRFSLYYLEMQKIRFRSALSYSIEVPPEKRIGRQLPVFSLQLLLENAIKHNKLTQDQPLCIRIGYADPDWLVVGNNVHEKLTVERPSGIGLKNLSERYMLLIQEDIRVHHDADSFQVYLKLIPE